MDSKPVKDHEGSPRPDDIFQPHMPGVTELPDMDALFDLAWGRRQADVKVWAPKDMPSEEITNPKENGVIVVTPGRLLMRKPCPPRGSMPPEQVEKMVQLLPPDPPLNVCAISYTLLEAMQKDIAKCIPFFGYMLAYAYVGHRVVIFEGHPSAFRSGVRKSDALFVHAA
jgi:hypothetical protein